MGLFTLADGSPVALDQLQQHWGKLRYRGLDLIETYCTFCPSESPEAQECYLGYDTQDDVFYVGFDGRPSVCCMVMIHEDGRCEEVDTYDSTWGPFYHVLYRELPATVRDLRLD